MEPPQSRRRAGQRAEPYVDGVEIREVPRGLLERPGSRTQPGEIPPLGTTFAPHFTRNDMLRGVAVMMEGANGLDRLARVGAEYYVRDLLRAVFPNATFESGHERV